MGGAALLLLLLLLPVPRGCWRVMSLSRKWNQRAVKDEEEVLLEMDDDDDDGDIKGDRASD